jgi:hypothetical protein
VTPTSRTIVVVAATIVLTLSGGASALPFAAGYSRHDGGASGADALTRASAVALAVIGGGRVTGTEVDDAESYYEVEVTLANGDQVDVHLDTAFRVVSRSSDPERHDGQADE